MPTSGAPRAPAPLCKAIMPALTATKNGKGYTASVKISQQNTPMPATLMRSARASMVVAPFASVTVAPSTTTAAQLSNMQSKGGGVAATQLRLGSDGDSKVLM